MSTRQPAAITEKDQVKRRIGFCIITIVYVIAGTIGLIIYRSLHYNDWLCLLIADVFAAIIVFIFSCVFRNASVYDPYWSVQPPVILSLYAISNGQTLVRILLLLVSIPMAENRQAEKTGYSEYKSRTRMLLPLNKNA